MPGRNGHLTPRHLTILRAIGQLQPCWATAVGKITGIDRRAAENIIYYTLYRRGLVESEIVRIKGRPPRRKNGTLRLTPEGESLANSQGGLAGPCVAGVGGMSADA